jgi:hypothetical protein
MDFVRERKAWEERLKRRAPSFEVAVDDAMMDELDQAMDVRGERRGADMLVNGLTMFR